MIAKILKQLICIRTWMPFNLQYLIIFNQKIKNLLMNYLRIHKIMLINYKQMKEQSQDNKYLDFSKCLKIGLISPDTQYPLVSHYKEPYRLQLFLELKIQNEQLKQFSQFVDKQGQKEIQDEYLRRIVTSQGDEGLKQKRIVEWVVEIEKIQDHLDRACLYGFAKRQQIFEKLMHGKHSKLMDIQKQSSCFYHWIIKQFKNSSNNLPHIIGSPSLMTFIPFLPLLFLNGSLTFLSFLFSNPAFRVMIISLLGPQIIQSTGNILDAKLTAKEVFFIRIQVIQRQNNKKKNYSLKLSVQCLSILNWKNIYKTVLRIKMSKILRSCKNILTKLLMVSQLINGQIINSRARRKQWMILLKSILCDQLLKYITLCCFYYQKIIQIQISLLQYSKLHSKFLKYIQEQLIIIQTEEVQMSPNQQRQMFYIDLTAHNIDLEVPQLIQLDVKDVGKRVILYLFGCGLFLLSLITFLLHLTFFPLAAQMT